MFDVPLLGRSYEDLYCPNCGLSERVSPPMPPGSSKFHNCPRLHMLSAPLVPVEMDCKVEAVEREDYLGDEIQNKGEDGKPYQAIKTTRADGSNDLAVNAGLAHADLKV
jgi:hypothetical protein